MTSLARNQGWKRQMLHSNTRDQAWPCRQATFDACSDAPDDAMFSWTEANYDRTQSTEVGQTDVRFDIAQVLSVAETEASRGNEQLTAVGQTPTSTAPVWTV